MIRGWPYLEPLKNKIAPKLDCDVGILIGYDCPKAQIPRDVISGAWDGPFGLRSYLGWGIVGIINEPTAVSNEPIGHSHRILTVSDTGSHITSPTRIRDAMEAYNIIRRPELSKYVARTSDPHYRNTAAEVIKCSSDEDEDDNSLDGDSPLKKLKLNRLYDNVTKKQNKGGYEQDTNRVMTVKRKLTKNSEFKSSNLKQSRVDIGTGVVFGDLNLPFIRLIIVFTLVVLSLGQPNDIHQRIILATSGLLCVGTPALAMRLASYLHDFSEPSRHLNSGKNKVAGPQVVLQKHTNNTNRRCSSKRRLWVRSPSVDVGRQFCYCPALKSQRKSSNRSSVSSGAAGLNKNSEGSIPASSSIN